MSWPSSGPGCSRPAPAPEEVAAEPEERLLARAGTLFASSHDVIAARRHFIDGASCDDELASSGDLTAVEHHAFLSLTSGWARGPEPDNPFARYVAAFQNWLRPAGASFDHLHKQLVAIDEYGPLMTRALGMLREAPDLFNTRIVDPAARIRSSSPRTTSCVAVAASDIGCPTVVASGTPARVPCP